MGVITWARTNMDRITREWTRQVETEINALRRERDREDGATANSSKNREGTLDTLAKTIYNQPYVQFETGSLQGFGLSSPVATTIVSASIAIPAGKSLVSLQAIGTAAVLDQTTGGLTNCYGDILLSDGTTTLISSEFSPAKDAGASQVNNVLTCVFGRSSDILTPGRSVYAQLRLRPLNVAAFPYQGFNYAAISLLASFTNPPRE